MVANKWALGLGAVLGAAWLSGCAGQKVAMKEPPAHAASADGYASPASAPSRNNSAYSPTPQAEVRSAPSAPAAPSPASQSAPGYGYDFGGSAAAPPPPEAREAERPGLGTEWGETRYSHVSHTSFERANSAPAQVLSLYYNDRDGARAMARFTDYREMGDAVVTGQGSGVSVALRDDSGRPLPAFYANGHTYAVGEAGQRYTIVVTNSTGVRVEAVASVDGLDVLDGKSASYAKRGYLVPDWGNVEIDGFRQTTDEVAAFRFGAVKDSYAARTGTDRNVGIVGVAVFPPRGAYASRWPLPWAGRDEDEVRRREHADPFPGHYASPPPRRW